MKRSLVAALSALLLSAGLAWADDAPAATQVSGTITDINAGAHIITVLPGGDLGGSKHVDTPSQEPGQVPPKKGSKDLIDQNPGQTPSQVPPKKGGDLIPQKDPPAIQEPGQVPPKKGSKDLIDQNPGQTPSQVPPKKGGDVPLKDGPPVIQEPGQVPSQVPPKKGSKDLIEPSQDQSQGQVPPKKGSKDVGGAAGISFLCDATTKITMGDKAVDFDALQLGQHVQVTYGQVSLVEPAVVPGKTDQVPSKTEPKIDQVPSKTPPVPSKEQVPAKASVDAPNPAVQGEEPSGSKGIGKKEGKAGPGKIQHAISILILPQEPIVPSKNGKQEPGQVPSKTDVPGKQTPSQTPSQVPSKTSIPEVPGKQTPSQVPSQVPSKVPAK